MTELSRENRMAMEWLISEGRYESAIHYWLTASLWETFLSWGTWR